MRVQTNTGLEVDVNVEDHLNKGEWFGKTFLIGIGCGFSTIFFVVEADSEGDALDTFVDSKGHLLEVDEEDVEEDWYCILGNEGVLCDLSELRVLEPCTIIVSKETSHV